MVLTLSSHILIPFPDSMYPRNSISYFCHSHLSGAMHRPLSHSRLRTSIVSLSSSSIVSAYIVMSSRNASIP